MHRMALPKSWGYAIVTHSVENSATRARLIALSASIDGSNVRICTEAIAAGSVTSTDEARNAVRAEEPAETNKAQVSGLHT